ncbi:hypothetical protein CH299_28980 [Rhodococcus sp. 14-2686-1-2]|nr:MULTISPECIES: hypothetical protein [unclassified Rhodococcus (in: high G+C Gram-positive bacteria)]OZE92943.1 hypothetical protein CH301_28465 [Rhodococcus sp. 15-1189-1-1a]OZF08197.1 hypothetical protein CH299_28980 [Rhodococcus sp. 14-2686-1-2]
MNIITAYTAQRQARDTLFADYTAAHVSDYTAAALAHSDHRERALRNVGFLLFIAAFGLAVYNFTLLWRGGADLTLVALTLGTLGAAFAVRNWARRTDAATIQAINTTVHTAEIGKNH